MASTLGTIAPSLSPAVPIAGPTAIAPADASLVQTAVSLSTDAGVLATFGNVASGVQTYDAAGLLNQIAQAGDPPATSLPVPPAGTDVPSLVQQEANQAVVGTLATDSTTSGIYTSSGALQSVGSSADWASILQSSPSMAGTVIADSVTQGIVGTLSVYA